MKENTSNSETGSPDDSKVEPIDFEQSLFSNPISRRRFLKRTGGATAGTVLALHGFRMNALSVSNSSGGPCCVYNVARDPQVEWSTSAPVWHPPKNGAAGFWRRYARKQEITFSNTLDCDTSNCATTSATSAITVTVTVERQETPAGGDWPENGDGTPVAPLTATYARVVTANLQDDCSLTYTADGQSGDETENGIRIQLNPTGSVTITGPYGMTDTMTFTPNFAVHGCD